MPRLLEAEQVQVEAKRSPYVSDEEHGARVPSVHDLLRHLRLLIRPTVELTRRRESSTLHRAVQVKKYAPAARVQRQTV
jgi:hypothetical protein